MEAGAGKQQAGCVEAYRNGCAVNLPGYRKPLSTELVTLETVYKCNYVVAEGEDFSVALDTTLDDSLLYEGLYRELLRHCQVLRREAGFYVDERIKLAISSKSAEINTVLAMYSEAVMAETLAVSVERELENPEYEKDITLSGNKVRLKIEAHN